MTMIKKNIKRLIKWFQNLLNTLFSIVKIFLFSSFKPSCKSVPKRTGKQCFILGNGPSLKTVIANNEIDLQNEEDVFVVNDFVLSEEFQKIKPAYYLLVDPGYWTDNTFIEMIELRNKVFESLNLKTSWKMILFVPRQAYKTRKLQQELSTNKYIDVKFFNTTEVKGFSCFENFSYICNLGMPVLQNVLVAAIYLAINIDYKRINILGADHSWLKAISVNNKNQVCQVNTHFYDDMDVEENVWLKFSGEPYLLHEVLIDLSKMFYAYHKLNSYGVYKRIEISNLTKGSFIDAFLRK